jgi:outer membrane protein TolC
MKHKFFGVLFSVCFGQFALAQEEVALDQVIALALEKNYDVRISKAVAASSKTTNDYAFGGFLPTVNATGSMVWNRNKQNLQFADENRNTKGNAEANNTNATVQLSWLLFDGARMFATRERVATLASQGELLVKDQMTNTIADVVANYYSIVRQKQQLKAIQEQMAVSEERVKLAERKLQVGTGIKPELLQARVDYNAQRTQVVQQQSAIAQLKEQLNALVDSQLPKVYDVSDTILIDLNLRPESITENVENTNFGLRAARESVHIASLIKRERAGEYLPFLSLNAAYVYQKVDNTVLLNPFGTTFSLNRGYNYGFTVNFPILNGFNTRRLNQLARIEINRQTILYDQLKTNINVGLLNAYTIYDNAKKILLIEEETIGLAKENVFIALESFKRGVTTFIELRTAQQSLADAYNRLIAARYNTKLAETELLRLSGRLLR